MFLKVNMTDSINSVLNLVENMQSTPGATTFV